MAKHHKENPLLTRRLRGNVDRERALADRVRVLRDPAHGADAYFVVDIETHRGHGPIPAAKVRAVLERARSCRVDDFLDIQWGFLELPLQDLPRRAQQWPEVEDDALPRPDDEP